MSGGSMNYLYSKVEDAEFNERTPLRRAFRAHIWKVAEALRTIEWNDSGDGDDGEDDAIRACLGEHAELQQLVLEADAARRALVKALNDAGVIAQ